MSSLRLLLVVSILLAACRFDTSGMTFRDDPTDARLDRSSDLSSLVDAKDDLPLADHPSSDQTTDHAADQPTAPWVDTAWTRRKRITVFASKANIALTDFPLLISLAADAELAAHAQKNGDDLLFCAADGSTKLSHEIEQFDDKSGRLVAWVKLPTLPTSSDTTLFLYYGGAASSSKGDGAAVFSNGYEAVWHLHHDPSKAVDDALGKHPGTSRGGMKGGHLVAGMVGQGYNFDGKDDAVDVGAVDLPPDGLANDGLTMEAWIKADKADGRIISKANGSKVNNHWWMCSLGDGTDYGYHMRLKTETATNTAWKHAGSTPPLVTWIHLAFTYNGTTMKIYKNGVPIGNFAWTGRVAQSSTIKATIGDNPVDDRYFDGVLDEVRLSRVARPPAWLATQHRNQRTPASFFTLGGEEQGP